MNSYSEAYIAESQILELQQEPQYFVMTKVLRAGHWINQDMRREIIQKSGFDTRSEKK